MSELASKDQAIHAAFGPTGDRHFADLARRFTALVRSSGGVGQGPRPAKQVGVAHGAVSRTAATGRDAVAEFGAWITRAKTCSATAIAMFASGLDGDATAVKAACPNPGPAAKPKARSIAPSSSSARATDEQASICSSVAWFSPHDPRKGSKSHGSGSIPEPRISVASKYSSERQNRQGPAVSQGYGALTTT